MILDQRQIDHIRKMYRHMNPFALAKSIEDLLETVVTLQTKIFLLENPISQFEKPQEKKS